MLDGQRYSLLREVEHIKDDGLSASVLTVVDGVDHLDDGLSLMHHFLLGVQTDDSQFTLYHNTVVHHRNAKIQIS